MANRNTEAEIIGVDEITDTHLRVIAQEIEALRVYRPATPKQERIHESSAHELVIRGGNRSGKSVCGFSEFVSRVMGRSIMDPYERPYPLRWPHAKPSDPRLYWIIGWDLKHIGQTIYRILFEPGMFRVIQEQDGVWRAWNQNNPDHVTRVRESVAAGPLIPARLIQQNSWVWDNSAGGASGNVFRSVQLINGAKICTYPSSAKAPKQGDPVDGILIDEDIQQPDHLEEFFMRLIDRNGWLIWTVYPQVTNFALVNLLDRAETVARDETAEKNIEAVELVMSENPFAPPAAISMTFDRLADEDAIARRDRGSLNLELMNMYDFSISVHCIGKDKVSAKPSTPKEVLEYVVGNERRIPSDWTRYLAIDPSHTRTAVGSAAVSPPEYLGVPMKRCVIVEWELVVKKFSAGMLAGALKEMIGEQRYEAFIMDKNAGRQTLTGRGVGDNVFEVYAREFAKQGIKSRLSGHSFIPGCNVTQKRYRAVRQFLEGDRVTPWLFFWLDRTRAIQREFATYRKKIEEKKTGETNILDEPFNPRKHDCMQMLEYAIAYLADAFEGGIAYNPAPWGLANTSGVVAFAQSILKSQNQGQEGYVHLGAGDAPRSYSFT